MSLHEPITETLKHIHFISHHLSTPLSGLMRDRMKPEGGLSGTWKNVTELREAGITWDYWLYSLVDSHLH